MRVVVVGGTGNIGTGVVKALLQFGHDVTVFSRGQRPTLVPRGVRYLTGDRQDRAAFEGLMQAERFDAAIDMICFNSADADSRWIDRVRRGRPLLITNGGTTTMSHCHADDAGLAYGAALGRSRCIGQSYILASPHHLSWREYHDQIADSIGRPVPLVDAPADFLIKVWPENTRTLAASHRWNHVMRVDKLRRDIPEFRAETPISYQLRERVRRIRLPVAHHPLMPETTTPWMK